MRKKHPVMLSLMAVLLVFCFIPYAGAGEGWKEKQDKIFAGIPVKPGDVIDKSNWEKVKDLLPEPFLEYGIKSGDWILQIAEFGYDHDYDAKYYELSAKNKGKYGLGEKTEIIDKATGKYPTFIKGIPFPDIDMKNDPMGPTKFMHNRDLGVFIQGTYAGVTYPEKGNLQWIGRNSGYERAVFFTMECNYWWNRPGGEIPNPRQWKRSDFLVVQAPYDLKGTATLYVRHLDGRDDSVYAYVPVIRRVKRLSGANRSDPQMGSDMCHDDADGFNGHVESMKWSYMGEKVILKPVCYMDVKNPRNLVQNKLGAWVNFTQDLSDMGFMDPNWNAAPWAYTKLKWIPREMYVIKAEPRDPYYAYGMMELYCDKLTNMVAFSMKYTKAGEFWKYLVMAEGAGTWMNGEKFFSVYGPMSVVDVKTDHASNLSIDNNEMNFWTPAVNQYNHTPQALRTATK